MSHDNKYQQAYRAKGEPFVPEFIKERRRKKALQAQEDAYNGND